MKIGSIAMVISTEKKYLSVIVPRITTYMNSSMYSMIYSI